MAISIFKKIGLFSLFSILSLSIVSLSATEIKPVRIGITAIVEHPALDSCRQGILDALIEAGYENGNNLEFRYENAQNNPSTAAQIAKHFVGDKLDVLVPISTPSAQAIAANTKEIPIVFSAVTDPVLAGLTGKNVTGVSDVSPIQQHFDLIKTIIPNVKKVGVIYNPGEANSVSLMNTVEQYLKDTDISLQKAVVAKTSDVKTATESLIGKVDAIYIPIDNTVVSAFDVIKQIAHKTKTPLFAGDTDTVERGAIATRGFNYYDVGKQTGKMIVKILQGATPESLPVETVQNTELYINQKAAEIMGVTIPETLLNTATKVIK